MPKKRNVGARWVRSNFVLTSPTATITISGPKEAKKKRLRELLPVWFRVAQQEGIPELVDDLRKEGLAMGLSL